jgi:hypothetical protein
MYLVQTKGKAQGPYASLIERCGRQQVARRKIEPTVTDKNSMTEVRVRSGFRAESDRNFRAAFRAAGFFFKSVPRRSSAFKQLSE